MIRLQRISTADGFLYEYMEQLITAAFPPEEHRPLEELRLYTDSRPHFYNNIIFHHDTPVGFITYWDFGKFYYVEHFAVDPAQRNGVTPEKLMEQMRPEAEKRIKTRLVLEKVVEVENVEVSDEKLDEQINEIAASYKLEGAKLKEMMGEREKEQIREDLKVQAAIDLLVEQAKLA